MNLKKKWAAGALIAVCCLADLMTPLPSLAAEVVSYSRVVSDVPGNSGQSYTGSSGISGQTSSGTVSIGPGSSVTDGTVYGSSGSGSVSTGDGPKMVDVTPSERYYEDYDIYSESINGLYYFYANVANNGMTDKPVSVDFPANISYTLEKDGVVMPYTSKQRVSDYGTYMFRILITEDASKPVYEQTVYRSTFIFRIQPKVEKPKEDTKTEAPSGLTGIDDGLVSDVYASSGIEDYYQQYVGQTQLGGIADFLAAAAEEMTDEKDKELVRSMARELAAEKAGEKEETAESSETGSDVDAESVSEEGTSAEEASAQTEDPSFEKEPAGAAERPAGAASRVGSSTSYVPSRGTYRTEFEDGTFLEVTSPNGLIGNTKVYVSLEGIGGQEKVTLLKNGKEEAVPEDGVFDQPGSYCLLCRTDSGVYPYSFRILDVSDSYLDYYTIPEGLELTAVEIDGRNVDPSIYLDKNGTARMDFTMEGIYQISMSDPDGLDFTAELAIDRTPPQVSVTNNKGAAYFSYNAQEVKEIILKDGSSETTFTQMDQVTTPGSYQAEFYDYAGNVTRVSFEVKRQINLATIAVIFMIIALAALAVVFYRKTKLDMDVK